MRADLREKNQNFFLKKSYSAGNETYRYIMLVIFLYYLSLLSNALHILTHWPLISMLWLQRPSLTHWAEPAILIQWVNSYLNTFRRRHTYSYLTSKPIRSIARPDIKVEALCLIPGSMFCFKAWSGLPHPPHHMLTLLLLPCQVQI